MEKLTPFTFINAINENKDIDITDEYNQYLVNIFFSLYEDTILIANNINMFNNNSNREHFLYYLGLVGKKKRFTQWPKKGKREVLDKIAEYFGMSPEKAKDAYSRLNTEQVDLILAEMNERNN